MLMWLSVMSLEMRLSLLLQCRVILKPSILNRFNSLTLWHVMRNQSLLRVDQSNAGTRELTVPVKQFCSYGGC